MYFQFEKTSDEDFHRLYGFAKDKPHSRSRWAAGDTEDTWTANQRDGAMRRLLDAAGWRIDSVEYRYNNHGFRSDDDWDVSDRGAGAMFLGCSITEGIGLNIEQTWGYRMSRHLGGRFYNMGQSGTGIETQYRLMRAWAPVLMPTAILTLGAIGPRREVLRDNGTNPLLIGAWTPYDEMGNTDFGLLSEADHRLSTERTLDAMRYTATRLGIPLYVPSIEAGDRARQRYLDTKELARDGMHHGPGYHEELSRGLHDWERVA